MRECTGNCGTCGGCLSRVEIVTTQETGIVTSQPTLFLDIGTTTVAGLFVYGDRSESIAFLNPQRSFGADVITRIQAAMEKKAKKMQSLIQEAVFSKVEELRGELDFSFCKVYVSANTTMQHLWEGLSCEGLGSAPYRPVDISAHCYELIRRGITYEIHMLPGISAFVGADVVSGIVKLNMQETEEINLLIDLGTNGEMALGNRNKLLVTSTAAGPAFESNPLALTLHASGIIELLSRMKDEKIVDGYGTLCDTYFETGYEGMTQDLIRRLQMAKAAICAGMELLVKHYGISYEDVAHVYLAGGMGKFIDPAKACNIGLIPQELVDKVVAVGNTSLSGAIAYAMEEEVRLPDDTKELLLAELDEFQDLYIERMNL